MTYQNPHGPGCFWHSFAESQGAPNIKWCEETLCQVISEPANTWSNLGYIVFGLWMLYLASKKNHHFELKQFGPIVFFMGITSFFYHQSNYYTSQIFDFVAMFFFVGWAMGMNFIRLGWMKKRSLIPFNIVLSAVYTGILHFMYMKGIKFQGIVLLSGFIILATEYLARNKIKVQYKYISAAIVFLVTAFSFSISDGQRFWCHPTDHGWFSQGHAMWHWIASVAMIFIYFHYSQPALIGGSEEIPVGEMQLEAIPVEEED